jgi:hypothetical protein
VQFQIDGTDFGGPASLDGNGQGTLTTALSLGNHTIAAVYSSTSTSFLNSTSATLTQAVNQASTSTNLASLSASVFGQSVTFTATVSATSPGTGTPSGYVLFFDNGIFLGSGALDGISGNDQATFSTAALSAGSHPITAVYSGDADFLASTSSGQTQTVTRGATSTAVSSSSSSSTFGQGVTFTAMVSVTTGATTPTGTVTFMDGTTTLGTATLDSSSQASLFTTALPGGNNQTITATYNGDANFTGSSGNTGATQTVTSASTATTVSSAATTTVSGQSVTLTATVSATIPGAGTPTGTVQFKENGANLGSAINLDANGQATFGTTGLPVGADTISAVYTPADISFQTSTSGSLTQTVSLASTSTTLSSLSASVFGQSVTFTVTVSILSPGSGALNGTVTFFDNGTALGTRTPDGSGQAILSTSSLTAGNHLITATYNGDSFNATSTAAALTQTVNQAATTTAFAPSANPSVFDQSVTFTATISAASPSTATPAGKVQFLIDGVDFGTPLTLSGGQATSGATSTLTVGTHTVTAFYIGSSNFTDSNASALMQTVNQTTSGAPTTCTLSPLSPSTFGQKVTFTATISLAVATGIVTFFDGGTALGTGTVSGGKATFSTDSLTVGNHSITANYSGDTLRQGSNSATLTQLINVPTGSTTTTTTLSSLSAAVFGQGVTFTATVTGSGATGIVTFFDNGTALGTGTVTSGQATVSTNSLAVGSHPITATYSGNGTFASSSTAASQTQTVNQASTSTVVTSSLTPSTFGQAVLLTATVSVTSPGAGSPTGTVTFKDGATTLGMVTLNSLDSNDRAVLLTSVLPVGSNQTITATYNGDTNFASSSGTTGATQTVNAASTTTKVASSDTTTVSGQSVTLTATVNATIPGAGTPTGTVQFKENGANLGSAMPLNANGQATFATTGLLEGADTITAVYTPADSSFQTSTSANLTQTVSLASTSTILSSLSPAVIGQSVSFNATVSILSPGTGALSGTVQFQIDGTNFGSPVSPDGSGNVTSMAISTLTAGNHTITANYSGDSFNAASTSPILIQVVNQASTSTTLASLAPSVFGQSVTLTATVNPVAPGTGTPSGDVLFFNNGVFLGSGALDGVSGNDQATFSTSSLSVGGHPITATYSGDANFLTSSDSIGGTQTVSKATTSTTVNSSSATSTFGQGVTFTAMVSVTTGATTPTGTVTFMDGTTTLGTATLDSSGQASLFTTALPGGNNQTITATYNSDANFMGSSGNTGATQSVTSASTSTALAASIGPSVTGESVTFTATVGAVSPGAGTPTGSVKFQVNGGTGTPVALDAKGQAVITTNLTAGSYTITAIYSGDANFQPGTPTDLTQTVNVADSQTALASSLNPSGIGQSVTFTAMVSAVSPGAGTPSAGTVTFFDGSTALVGTVSYATVGSSLQATLSTSSLGVGNHTISAIYSGDVNFSSGTSPILAQAVYLFSDNFNRANSSSLGSSWQIPPLPEKFLFTYRRRLGFGGFQLQSNKAVSLGSAAFDAEQVTGGISLLNPSLQADVNASNAAAVGLVARLQSNGDAYVGVLTNGGQAQIWFFHAATNSFTVLNSANAGTNAANLQFTVSGSSLSLYVNGTLKVSVASDTSLPSPGGVGIFAWGPGGSIGNFWVNGT